MYIPSFRSVEKMYFIYHEVVRPSLGVVSGRGAQADRYQQQRQSAKKGVCFPYICCSCSDGVWLGNVLTQQPREDDEDPD